MLRNPWFWIAIALIACGVALTAALGVFYWLIVALATAGLVLVIVFLVAAYAMGRAEAPEVPQLQDVPDAERIPVIYDCDLTMGWPFRDVGDGLALLYLLGEPRIDLRCITTTYGNGPVWMTTRTTRRLLKQLDVSGEVPIVPGAAGPNEEPEENRAARRMVEIVSERPDEIVLVATGCMTNLKHALALDPDFFTKLRGLSLMGGVTEPLVWNERQLKEINVSLDPEAAYLAIHADCPIILAPGQAGLSAVFRGPQFAALQTLGDPVSRLIVRKTRFWFALMRLWFQDDGFAMWDSLAALAFVHPDLLDVDQVHLPTTRRDLRTGRLVIDAEAYGGPVRLVRSVSDYDGFIAAHFAAWHRLGRQIEDEKGNL